MGCREKGNYTSPSPNKSIISNLILHNITAQYLSPRPNSFTVYKAASPHSCFVNAGISKRITRHAYIFCSQGGQRQTDTETGWGQGSQNKRKGGKGRFYFERVSKSLVKNPYAGVCASLSPLRASVWSQASSLPQSHAH